MLFQQSFDDFDEALVGVMRFVRQQSVQAGNAETLIVGQHSELGVVAFWLPDGDYQVSSGQNIAIAQTKVKIAEAPKELRNEHNISALVAVKDCDKITFSAEIKL